MKWARVSLDVVRSFGLRAAQGSRESSPAVHVWMKHQATARSGLRRMSNTLKEHRSRQRSDSPKARAGLLALPAGRRLRREWAGGFTIVEVTMFLTITSVIFVAATLIFHGQQGKTQFEQSMNDLASRLQQVADQVDTSIFNGSGEYSCSGAPGNTEPVLTQNGGSAGTSQGCIFLGYALGVAANSSNLSYYEVLGNQYQSNGSDLATTLAQAVPTVEFGVGNDLVTTYSVPWAKLSSSTYTDGTNSSQCLNNCSHIVGIYNNLESGGSGGQSLTAIGSDIATSSPNNSQVQGCVQDSLPACTTLNPITSWSLCYDSTSSSQTALLTVTAAPTGLNTNIQFVSCS